MTDNAYDRCRCGHARQKHRYAARCDAPSRSDPGPLAAYGLKYRCDCTRFELRPPRWRVFSIAHCVEWFGPPVYAWYVQHTDSEPLSASFGDHATAFRVASALAAIDDELEQSMRRHPAGRRLSAEARAEMLRWPTFRPMFPNADQVVDEARAKLRMMPDRPNPLLDSGGSGYTLSALFAEGRDR